MIVFTDFACPFCYLAEVGLGRLAGVDVVYRAYELRPAPAGLESPAADPAKAQGWDMMIAPRARAAGVPMVLPRIGVRTRKAHEAARFARTKGVERAMRDALYDAYFRGGRDIGRIDVIVQLGVAIGLDAAELKVVLDIDTFTDEIVTEERSAASMGLTGVPAYIGTEGMEPALVVGLQDHDGLTAWVETRK